MGKIDSTVINNIKLLSLDMIKSGGSGDSGLSLGMAHIFYNLYLNHINYQSNNTNWINRDRVIVNNRYLPLMYSTMHMFGYNLTLDDLNDYKKLNSNTPGFSSINTSGIEVSSITNGDILGTSAGIALGARYIDGLIKNVDSKCKLIDFKTYCICTIDDLMSGIGAESLSFISKEKLNNLIIICNKDNVNKDSKTDAIFKENMLDKFISLDFEIFEIKNGYNASAFDSAVEEAKASKKPSIIIVSTKYAKDTSIEGAEKYFNTPLSEEDINELAAKYKMEYPVNTEECKSEVGKLVEKRMNKVLEKWQNIKNEYSTNIEIKKIIEFLETKELKIEFNSDNLKLNDNYNEELILGNSKIFNLFAAKSPFVLSISNDNFKNTLCCINKSSYMSNTNKIGKNILMGSRTLCMPFIANGLATFGFKVFVSAPLIDSVNMLAGIKLSLIHNNSVNYIFTQDTFTNSYECMGISAYNELNMLRLMPGLINFRPCDINEIMGVYEIIGNYNKPIAMIIGSEKVKKLSGTHPKYVMGGAYRVYKENEELNGVIVASGEEVSLAISVSEELKMQGIDLRVVSMPSLELFNSQEARYQDILIPKDVKTFVIEFSSSELLEKYATNKDYVFGLQNYPKCGSKSELLKEYNLTKDFIKTKIVELFKS